MKLFLLGLVLFFVPHFYSALRSRADGKDIRKSMGELKYMGRYSIVCQSVRAFLCLYPRLIDLGL